MRWAISISFAVAAWSAAFSSDAVETTSPTTIQLDPFAQATRGFDGCPMSSPTLVTPEEMRVIAHERAERGTYCALEGRCEPGGAYRRDPEVNERVRAAVAQDQAFRPDVGRRRHDPPVCYADRLRALTGAAPRAGRVRGVATGRRPRVRRNPRWPAGRSIARCSCSLSRAPARGRAVSPLRACATS